MMGVSLAASLPAYLSQGFNGLPALPAPPAIRPDSPIWQQMLVVMSSSLPWVPSDQKALSKDFIFDALWQYFRAGVERRQMIELQKVIKHDHIKLQNLYLKEDLWFNEKGLDAIKLVRKLVKPYLKEREDFSVLLMSNDDDDELSAPLALA